MMTPSLFPSTLPGKVIHVANIKGGVGKSTVATNLAACLSAHGKTLVIDLDVQGSASYAMGQEPRESFSSYELLRYAFKKQEKDNKPYFSIGNRIKLKKWTWNLHDISKLTMRIHPNLDLIPASPDLFKPVSNRNARQFLSNLHTLQSIYQYIVIDTPSVWNEFIKRVFRSTDLNLIPINLTALSTRSLKDYLKEIRRLVRKYPRTRIRIVKNEVFGKKSTRIMGKVKTISENRAFLDSLSEVVRYASGQSALMLPQSVILDLEIPETSAIQQAQDRGVPLVLDPKQSVAKKSFHELTNKVLAFLRSLPSTPARTSFYQDPTIYRRLVLGLQAAAIFAIIFITGSLVDDPSPKIIAIPQLEKTKISLFTHTFRSGENIYKFAKYAINQFRAIVPSNEQVENYVQELIFKFTTC